MALTKTKYPYFRVTSGAIAVLNSISEVNKWDSLKTQMHDLDIQYDKACLEDDRGQIEDIRKKNADIKNDIKQLEQKIFAILKQRKIVRLTFRNPGKQIIDLFMTKQELENINTFPINSIEEHPDLFCNVLYEAALNKEIEHIKKESEQAKILYERLFS